jgi:hypothetical protein
MAKFVFKPIETDVSPYEDTLELQLNAGHTRATYVEESTGAKITMFGENLATDAGDPNFLADGIVEKIVFTVPDSDTPYLTVTGAHFKAEKLGAALADGNIDGLMEPLFRGNDKIIGGMEHGYLYGFRGDDEIFGSKGEDSIFGGMGDDELTGRGGPDTFCFQKADGVGHDVITDMDIVGMTVDYLNIDQDIKSIAKANHGNDTMLTLEDGSTIQVEDVTRVEFLDYWNS